MYLSIYVSSTTHHLFTITQTADITVGVNILLLMKEVHDHVTMFFTAHAFLHACHPKLHGDDPPINYLLPQVGPCNIFDSPLPSFDQTLISKSFMMK